MGFLIKLAGKELKDIEIYLKIAVENIIEGKVIAFPTDSVYGIGGDPQNIEVINRIYDIKFRDRSKGLLLLLSDYEEANKIAEFNDTTRKLANHYWPGQLTLILKRRKPCIILPEVSAFQDTIGIRVPENQIILSILKLLKSEGYFGGIIGTSANYSGEPPSISGKEVTKKILSPIDLIIDSGKSKSKLPTTIVDCTSKKIKFLRLGEISNEEILEFVSK
ncbi:MAG: threonylcarbamoyl-AMP synthase [Promethearchaeota archaeon Loki_b32]|nr:MAG: threonylcarbamoyl-AMP synthase [Candidatus Lokiarchaeota archaeon Loki_b32]